MKLLIYASILLSVICMVAINANLPAYADRVGISTELTGWIVSMNPLMCLFFSVPFAYLSDKYNRFVVIFIGLAFYLIASLVLVYFKNIEALFLVKILEGLAIAAFLPAVVAFISDISEQKSISENMGSFTSVFNLGFIVAPAISAFLGEVYNIEAIFIFVLICSILNIILCWPIYRLYKKTKPVPVIINEIVSPSGSNYKDFIWPVIITVSLLSFTFGYAFGLYDTIWAYYIFDRGGNIFMVNLTYFCYALPVVLLSTFMGKLADKYENLHWPILLGSLIISITILSYGIIPYPLLIALLCSLEGVGNSAVFPCMNSAMIKAVDNSFKGRSLGIFNSARTAGSFIGAIVNGYLYSLIVILPFIINFVLVAVCSIIAAVSIFKYRHRLKTPIESKLTALP